jgi:RNA polymerase sigma factor (sigma-70 family)
VHTISYPLVCKEHPALICELSGLDAFPSDNQAIRWTEEELAHIRLVLKKLTSQRIGNPADAEDLVQDTLLTMVRKAPDIDIEKGMLIWAMGILRKKVGNYYRRVRRFSLLDGQIRHVFRECRTLTPEAQVHHAELRAMIEGMLRKLQPQERAAIDLYLAGSETSEIVSLLHPERYQNVVNRLHRGRKKLARALSRYGYARTAAEKHR